MERIDNQVNLYAGKPGIAIFFAHLYKLTKEENYQKYSYSLMSDSINEIKSLSTQHSLAGISGTIWALHHLVNVNFFEYNEIKPYSLHLKSRIISTIDFETTNLDYDLMYGFIGKLIALREIYHSNNQENREVVNLLSQSVHHLYDIAVQEGESMIYWTSPHNKRLVITGMAHGISSIIWYLSKIIKDNILDEFTTNLAVKLVRKAANWLTDRGVNINKNELCVPKKIYLDNHSKLIPEYRLAWCQGDLGVAVALISASEATDDQSLFKQGLSIIENISSLGIESIKLRDSNHTDSTICHGTFGIFLIFYLLHKKTGSKKLELAYQYWLERILREFDPSKDYCNLVYAYFNEQQQITWNNSPGLLNGLSGNGLVLLTYYLRERGIIAQYNWFDIFI